MEDDNSTSNLGAIQCLNKFFIIQYVPFWVEQFTQNLIFNTLKQSPYQ